MLDDFLAQYNRRRQRNELFATATVVWREAPSSGKAGDRAIIDPHGDVWGWVGGGCTRGIVLKEASAAMQEGKSRLVRVSPDPATVAQQGINQYKMTCQSGGSVDIFIEPVMPKIHLIILGKSAIAQALASMAKLLDYRITVMAMGVTEGMFREADEVKMAFSFSKTPVGKHTFVVVATQGEQDEMALKSALKVNLGYLAFVASRKKRDAVFDYLRLSGVDERELARVKTPAGLDIKAATPHEVAISILAEIIQTARTEVAAPTAPLNLVGTDKFYINPVCGVPVDKTAPKHIVAYKDEAVYFCCDGCKVKFEAQPEKYMTMTTTTNS
ncbi:XdhC family protein [Fibrella sp. HMF5335]|uniref:XdhC family protein n=1 Tax=Fibrella rubiginis TaxID=2817060 RepID=A0A939GMB4_9BACT|nr:XdhC family protein [Fibrella rubiginis]MBO0939047.1 XdhC family protein [Fibrella rubiginis]